MALWQFQGSDTSLVLFVWFNFETITATSCIDGFTGTNWFKLVFYISCYNFLSWEGSDFLDAEPDCNRFAGHFSNIYLVFLDEQQQFWIVLRSVSYIA